MHKLQLSVGVKLFVSFFVIAALLAGVALYAYSAVETIDAYVNDIYANHLRPIHDLGTADALAFRIRGDFYKYILVPAERAAIQAEIEDGAAAIDAAMAYYRAIPKTPEEEAALAVFDAAWADYQAALQSARRQVDQGQAEAVIASLADGELAQKRTALTDAAAALVEQNDQIAKAVHEQSDAQKWQLIGWLLAVTAVGLLVAFGFAFFIGRSLARNIAQVTATAQALAAGDLGQRANVHSGDEIETLANAFNSMAAHLQEQIAAEQQAKATLEAAVNDCSVFASRVAEGDLTARLNNQYQGELSVLASQLNEMAGSLAVISTQVRGTTQNINAAATQILATVSEHTASANEQSAAVNQVTATVSEAQASAQQVAGKATEVAQLAQDAVRVGQDGAAAVENILAGMQDIRTKVEGIARNILALSEQTQQIGDIIATVTDIADQSNILAINAAIEAAKAGEQGRGFAVVAGEVRNLAEQSKQATAKVRSILGEIQKATNTAVLATEQGTRGVESGMALTHRAGEVINQLTGAIRGAAQSAQQIAAASRQQSSAMDQIAQAMREINQATVQFVAGARQSQSAAEGLNDLARQLTSAIQRYKV